MTCCVYQSRKVIRTTNPVLVITYWTLTLVLIAYIGLWQIWHKKGYQAFEYGVGTVSTKVKGTATNNSYSTNVSQFDVFTADDLVYPSTEQNALFLTTSDIYTHQTRGVCDGEKKTGVCRTNADCINGKKNWDSLGVLTGNCSNGFCQIKGWCPLETDDEASKMLYYGVENFTIFLKVNLQFKRFDVLVTNTVTQNTSDHSLTPGYNLFTVEEILRIADTDISSIADWGAIILCTISYDCNLDIGVKHCEDHPRFSFLRIDDVKGTVSPGYNFRTTEYQDNTYLPNTNSSVARIVNKRMGLRILFVLDAQAGKFDLSTLTITIGSGLALLGLATIGTDYFMTYCIKDHATYYKKKGEYISFSAVDG